MGYNLQLDTNDPENGDESLGVDCQLTAPNGTVISENVMSVTAVRMEEEIAKCDMLKGWINNQRWVEEPQY